MRISDWSSDVCSSDLGGLPEGAAELRHAERNSAAAARACRAADRECQGGRSRSRCAGNGGYRQCRRQADADRQSVVEGKSVSVRVDLGGRRILKKKKKRGT